MAVINNLYKRGTHFRGVFDLQLDHSVAPERALRILNAAVKHVSDQEKIHASVFENVHFKTETPSNHINQIQNTIYEVVVGSKNLHH